MKQPPTVEDLAIATEVWDQLEAALRLRGLVDRVGMLTYPWQIETKAGLLLVSWTMPWRRGERGGLYCRFEEPQRATALQLGNNPHSGKWNHLLPDGASAAECQELLRQRLTAVLE